VRDPDFLIVGAMKCGTTALYRWLDEHPGVRLPGEKEPHFFSEDERFARGLGWYRGLFTAPEGVLTGEASVGYLDPAVAEKAAARIAEHLPRVRLVAVLRDPVDRLVSHYLHDVRKARERRPLREAVAEVGTAYERRSRYAAALAPYLTRFGPERFVVLRFDGLTREPHPEWSRLVEFLGLPAFRPTFSVPNPTAELPRQRRVLRFLLDAGLYPLVRRVPRPVRRLGRSLAFRGDPLPPKDALRREVPAELVSRLRDEEERLRGLLARWASGLDPVARSSD